MLRFVALSCLLLSVRLQAQPQRISAGIIIGHRFPLRGSLPRRVQASDDRGRADSSLQLGYITLALKPTAVQQASLERLLEEQQDHSSANYHRWLTPEQFGDRFGVSGRDLAKVTAWIQSEGFHVESIARARNWVAFSGPAPIAERAFGTEIHRYALQGEQHYSNATELSIPEALADIVSGVRGLDDFSRTPAPAVPEDIDSKFVTSSVTMQLAPYDWTTFYNVKPLYSNGIDGTGQRLAILGTSHFPQAFLDSFRSMFGLPPSQIEMHLVGPDPGITGSESEAALDLEWSGAIAPSATLVYVYATNFNDAAQAAIDQNLATVMSQSFGTCEPLGALGESRHGPAGQRAGHHLGGIVRRFGRRRL